MHSCIDFTSDARVLLVSSSHTRNIRERERVFFVVLTSLALYVQNPPKTPPRPRRTCTRCADNLTLKNRSCETAAILQPSDRHQNVAGPTCGNRVLLSLCPTPTLPPSDILIIFRLICTLRRQAWPGPAPAPPICEVRAHSSSI